MTHKISELAKRLGGTPSADLTDSELEITGFATDSNAVNPGDLFLAIKGARVDGHDFVPKALESGAVAALVERPVPQPHVLVDNVVNALATMASSFRTDFHGPVVGITGSAGKTTTKEFLAVCLQLRGGVLKTEGNRNTEFTAPLLWAESEPSQFAAVVEMAMRGFGQIAHLANFTRPTHAIITNIGYAHVETVGSREGIAKAKGEILEALPHDGTAILWSEDEFLGSLIAIAGDRPIKTFGYSGNADCQITGYKALSWNHSVVSGHLNGESWEANIPTVGRHLALNAAAAILAANLLGVEPQLAASQLANATLPPMRMEIREYKGATLVLDNYNASPPAVLSALEALNDIETKGKRIAVLGTMRELGEEAEPGHREVGRAISNSKVDVAILFGPPQFGPGIEWIKEAAESRGQTRAKIILAQTQEEVHQGFADLTAEDTILVKGSRALELERLFDVDALH